MPHHHIWQVWELDYGNGSGKRLCDAELVKLRRIGKYKRQQHTELVPLMLEAKSVKPTASALIRDLAMETGAEPVRPDAAYHGSALLAPRLRDALERVCEVKSAPPAPRRTPPARSACPI